MEYTVVKEMANVYSGLDPFIDEVNNMISCRYKPIGGVSMIRDGGNFYYAQAMIRENEED